MQFRIYQREKKIDKNKKKKKKRNATGAVEIFLRSTVSHARAAFMYAGGILISVHKSNFYISRRPFTRKYKLKVNERKNSSFVFNFQ